MLCEKGYSLIKELSRNDDNLPPYNTELINDISRDIQQMVEQCHNDAQESVNDGTETNLLNTVKIRNAAIKRNVRCLMAYHYQRIKSLRTMRWEFGSILPADIKVNLSPAEVEWFSKYSRLLANYMRSIGDEGVNLAVNLKPPKALYIEVQCLVDYGKFELNDGTNVFLKKDSRHYLPRSECEDLIRQGVFKHIV